MLLASTDLETFRRHFQRHIMAPIGMLIIAVVLVAAFGLYWTTSTSNAVSVEQQAQITKLGLSTSADQLSYEQQVIGRWDQRPRRLAEQPASGTWYNAQVSAWASRMFKHDISFFVDAGNLPFYGYESGSSIGQPRLDRLAAELKPMIASVRSQARARYPGDLSPATGSGKRHAVRVRRECRRGRSSGYRQRAFSRRHLPPGDGRMEHDRQSTLFAVAERKI